MSSLEHIHPSVTLKEEFYAHGVDPLTDKRIEKQIGKARFDAFLNGDIGVDGEIARALTLLGTTKEYWLTLQERYEAKK